MKSAVATEELKLKIVQHTVCHLGHVVAILSIQMSGKIRPNAEDVLVNLRYFSTLDLATNMIIYHTVQQ